MTLKSVVSVAEAKKSLSELLGRVAYGDESITIVKRGRPMAQLVPVQGEGRPALRELHGWLSDDAPFFQAVEEVVRRRHRRRPRRAARVPA